MLPRSKSIFHLGEEGGDHAKLGAKRARENLVGLQILIQQQHRQSHGSNIVFKPTIRLCAIAVARTRHVHRGSCFLKACFLCKKELSPNKDVYMGDQGFCSEACRCQQILLDEAREVEAIKKERRGLSHHHSPRSPIRGGPRKTLAVA